MARASHSHHRLAVIALGLLLCVLLGYPRARDASFAQQAQVSVGKSGLHPAHATVVPGPEVLVSPDEDFAHVETMLAANPSNHRHLLASSIILPKDKDEKFLFRTRAYVSRDAGKTWRASPLPDENLWDPVAAFTPRGTALFVCLLPPRSLLVFRSEDGAAWKDRTDLAFTDGAMIAVDWTRGKHHGQIYLAGRKGEERTDPIVVHRSADDGRRFETSVAVEKPIVGRVLNLLVLQDGEVFLPFSTRIDKDTEQVAAARSLDGGQVFSRPLPVAKRRIDTKGRYGDWTPAAFAAGSHAGKERLYALYTVTRGAANARLVLSRSDDRGRTWSEAKDIALGVADELTHGAASVSVNRFGVVGMSWLQRSIGLAHEEVAKECQQFTCFNETYDLFFTASLDGGDTFLPPVRITSRSSNPRPKHASRFWPGFDYMLSTAASDGTFHLLWPDARTGTFQLYTSAVRVE